MRSPWRVGYAHPRIHWADSSPRAHDGHVEADWDLAKRHGPNTAGEASWGPKPQAKRRGPSAAGEAPRDTRHLVEDSRRLGYSGGNVRSGGGGHHARHDLHYRASVTARTGLKAARCPSRSHYPVLSCLSSPSVLRLLDSRLQ